MCNNLLYMGRANNTVRTWEETRGLAERLLHRFLASQRGRFCIVTTRRLLRYYYRPLNVIERSALLAALLELRQVSVDGALWVLDRVEEHRGARRLIFVRAK